MDQARLFNYIKDKIENVRPAGVRGAIVCVFGTFESK